MLAKLLSYFGQKKAEQKLSARQEYLAFENQLVQAEKTGAETSVDADEFCAVCDELALTPSMIQQRVQLRLQADAIQADIETWTAKVDASRGKQAELDRLTAEHNEAIRKMAAERQAVYDMVTAGTVADAQLGNFVQRKREVEAKLEQLLLAY